MALILLFLYPTYLLVFDFVLCQYSIIHGPLQRNIKNLPFVKGFLVAPAGREDPPAITGDLEV